MDKLRHGQYMEVDKEESNCQTMNYISNDILEFIYASEKERGDDV